MAAHSTNLDFQEAARYVQEGAWPQAAKILDQMLVDNPEHRASILPLLEDVRLKAGIKTRGIGGRSQIDLLFTRKHITYALLALLLIVLAFGGWGVYTNVVVPARAQQLERSLLDAMIEQARSALGGANYVLAADLFQKVLEAKPGIPEAEKGYREAQRQIELAASYDEALQLIAQGNTAVGLQKLKDILAAAPGYRDVQKKIDQIQKMGRLGELLIQAEVHFKAERWEEAIPLYVEIRQSNQGFESLEVDQKLYESYVNLADNRSGLGDLSDTEVEGIAQLYRMALSLRPKDQASRLHEQMMTQYLQAGLLIDVDRFGDAIVLLDGLYQTAPGMLDGDPIRRLYTALVGYGRQLEEGSDHFSALTHYSAAQNLPIEDVSEATLRVLSVSMALTPTPTPTPEPTATPIPDPFAEYLKSLPPQASPIENYPGWIVFQSDRPFGSRYGLWVISPDGKQQLPVNDPEGRYEHLKAQAQWSNDNQRRIWVESDGGGSAVAIYMWRYDIPAHWLDARVELLNNSAINYQPSLSPDNSAIVFTSQRDDGPLGTNYGDEIFILYFSDFNSYGHASARRLTKNDWEWDKHASFSPDGRTIAFWSNRETGRAQIWAMTLDGSNQRNLSNSEWNDWDPVYIAPFREIPQFGKGKEIGPIFDPGKQQGNQ